MAKEDVKLLGAWPSPYVLRARIALNVKSVEYEFLEETFGVKSELLLKSNPVHKKIPVLIHQGKPICESLIIVEYIDEVWSSGPSILPSDPFDRATARFWGSYVDEKVLSYGRERRVILEAARQDKGCVLANVLAAHFLASSDPPRAPEHYQVAKSRLEEATQYERAIFDAVSSLICEDRDDDIALELHSKLLDEYPKDLVSLKRAQVLSFYMGRPDLSLDLVEKVLPANAREDYVYGMLAFPLLELGRMADAEEAARKGYHINNHDYWSQHAICHVLQYECRFKEAVEFMELCSRTWTSCSSFMLTHNWWHVALCYLEGHCSVRKVIEVYDEHIWKELDREDSSPAEVYLNALGLLLRLYVRGEFEALGDRLKFLSELVSNQAHWYLEWHLDLYIIWALAQAGERSKAEDLLNGLRSRISKKSKKKQQRMQRAVLLAEAMFEYGNHNNERALEILGPTFDAKECKMVGASDEQLDVFNEVWFSMLLDSGRTATAIEVISEQIKKREGSPYLWRLLEKGYVMTGSQDAAAAGDKARALEATHFA